jgi:Zn-dependent metalloprotease
MAGRKLQAKVERDPVRKTPSRLHDITGAPGGRTPRQVAVNTLKALAPTLKIEPDLKALRFDKVKKTVLGSHVLFQQCHKGKPISGAWIRVDIDRNGKVYNVLNDLVPQAKIEKAQRQEADARSKAGPELKPADVRARALAEAGGEAAGAEILKEELVYYAVASVPVRAWKVIVHTKRPVREWKMYLDALSGQVLQRADLLKLADGQGRVFNPNPVVSLNDTSIEDDSTIPPAAYVSVALKDLKAGGRLDGPFVSTRRTPDRVRRANLKFTFSRSDRPFKEVMVYFHIDAAQRYIQDLGFNNILNRPVEVHIDGRSDDNSHYSPTTKSLTFGTGGVDDAEDAEIILHEYGHAIQDDQIPGWGASAESGAMGEGFGDYFAASFFAESKPQILRPTVGSWDAVAYSGAEPPCLRRLDSNKRYPKDITNEVHDDGEIWSACLWDLRGLLGRRVTDRLVLAHHFLLKKDSSFEDAAKAMLLADANLNGARNADAIRGVFVRCGVLPNAKRKNRRAGIPFADVAGANGVRPSRRLRRRRSRS